MMNFNKFGYFILILTFAFAFCKSDSKTSEDMFSKKDTSGVNAVIPESANATKPIVPVPSSFNNPDAMARNKYSRFDTILIKDLSNKFWKFDGGIEGSKNITPEEMAGFWIQFYDNGKYEKGTYSKVTSRGNYTVDNLGFIELMPREASEKKSEWQSKFNNDMLILVGTPKYNDNHIQMRLSRIMSKPQQVN
ncbi:MAG: hypothetical protein SH818_17340 [Saprospiraceae bacterium]|nr:hypothetical protein [Saprospiraceae bacterium]